MKWCRFSIGGGTAYGLIEGDRVRKVDGTPWERHTVTGGSHALGDVKLELPVIPSTFFCVGVNYRDHVAVNLPYGRKRALEIATTLALDPEMLLLDEPTSGMGHEDVDRIAELIRKVSSDRTILMVEHNLSVVAALSDTITVLAQGRVLAEGNYETVSRDPRVIEAYIGGADD